MSAELVNCYVVPPADLRSALYAEWAHYHWVWLSSDRANQSSMMQYAQDYLDHGIQVGAVDLDSGWSTGYNNFIFDTTKYPNASEMVEFFHSKGIRVILWVTSMVDTDSSNYQEAYDNGYFIRDIFGKQSLFKWWHGTGGLLDYTNEEAVQWWHGQIDQVLSMGIDGWKPQRVVFSGSEEVPPVCLGRLSQLWFRHRRLPYRQWNSREDKGTVPTLVTAWSILTSHGKWRKQGTSTVDVDDSNQTLDIYKMFVDTHYQLVDYLLTTGTEAFETNTSSITPLAKHSSFIDKLIDDFNPDTYNYLLGPNILVAPITSNDSTANITFPVGSSWIYWWDHSKVYQGGSTLQLTAVPLEEFPVFFKNGTFLPLRVTPGMPLLGEAGFAGHLCWLLHSPSMTSPHASHSSHIRQHQGPGITATYWWLDPGCIAIEISAHPLVNSIVHLTGLESHVVRVHTLTAEGGWKPVGEATSLEDVRGVAPAYWHPVGGTSSVFLYPGPSREEGHRMDVCFGI
eukprot:Em0020g725a